MALSSTETTIHLSEGVTISAALRGAEQGDPFVTLTIGTWPATVKVIVDDPAVLNALQDAVGEAIMDLGLARQAKREGVGV